MLIGIAGTFGAGKGAVTEYLKQKGFVQYSSSAMLGELVEKDGNPRTRNFLGPMATKLQEKYPGGVVEKNYQEKYLDETPKDAIFEALHRQSEANFLKSVGGIIIGIDADLDTRYKRTQLRNEGEKDQKSFDDFKEMSRIEEEGGGDKNWDNNIRAVLDMADHTIMNNGTVEELYAQVEEFLRQVA